MTKAGRILRSHVVTSNCIPDTTRIRCSKGQIVESEIQAQIISP